MSIKPKPKPRDTIIGFIAIMLFFWALFYLFKPTTTMEVTSDAKGATAVMTGPFGGKTTCKTVYADGKMTTKCE